MLGAGFPDGPAKLADSEGLAELVDVLDDLHEETGEKRYEATDFLREAAEAGASTVTRAPTPTERPTATHSPLTTPSTSPSRTASATSRSTARIG